MVTIHAMTPEDDAEWRALWNGYLAFYEARLDAETSAAAFDRLLDPASPVHGAFARDERGDAVGLVHWLTHPATWTRTDYCYLEDLFVAPAARRAGVGAALIAHVVTWARQHGSAKVYWLTEETNETARALYDRVATRSGFIQYQVKLTD
ncbi:MAG: GNAT family N-acetyltransferase [Microbacterium sp.]|uniref:GNAT family N-acetyltransferase n=1 Tax=Microbacterium sp. TaxID=51671 RepID=UPI0039E40404